MDFYKLIKSLDELVFEILSWLYFYPRTLIRTLLTPFGLMLDTEKRMDEDPDPAWGDRIGPPLFLALTLAVIHGIEIGIGIDAVESYQNEAIKELMSNDTNLLAVRIVLFGALPLLAAARELKVRGIRMTKSALQAPFYAQCYPAAGYAVLVNATYFAAHDLITTKPALGAAILFGGLLVSALWVGFVETRWFHRRLETTRLRAMGHAFVLLLQWLLLAVAVTLVLS
ncbi:hypothetical protein [Sphingomicrobium nitratireducens]|uniref:hypothetical protein n=1 Tax=Sphingomicrobium nitratireducens TaxID=2964666 RepID=UPI002240197D|nr:hypothetical protein [Sphingomicrobium nitratireducens]